MRRLIHIIALILGCLSAGSHAQAQWHHYYNSPSDFTLCDTDSVGNVYAVSTFTSWSTTPVIAKYSSAGIRQWVVYGAADTSYAKFRLTPTGDPVFTCVEQPSGMPERLAVEQYTPLGAMSWRRYVGLAFPNTTFDALQDPGFDDAGNVYVTAGYGSSTTGARLGTVIVALDASGNRRWEKNYGSSGKAWSLAAVGETAGNAIAVGTVTDTAGDTTAVVTRLSPSGATLWTRYIDVSAMHSNAVTAGGVDSAGDVVVAGVAKDASGQSNMWISEYDSNRALKWREVGTANTALTGLLPINHVVFDSAQTTYVAGFAGNNQYFLAAFSATGSRLWLKLSNAAQDLDFQDLALDNAGHLPVLSTATASGLSEVWLDIRSESGALVGHKTFAPAAGSAWAS